MIDIIIGNVFAIIFTIISIGAWYLSFQILMWIFGGE